MPITTTTPQLSGKDYLAARIVGLMPPHQRYVEPYTSDLTVLLAKDPTGVSEAVNDLSGKLTNLWRVLNDNQLFTKFRRVVKSVPLLEGEWNEARYRRRQGRAANPAQIAAWFFIFARKSLAGRTAVSAPPPAAPIHPSASEAASARLATVDGLPAVHDRLRRVAVLHRSPLDVIRSEDGPTTLFYLDPPHLYGSRAAPAAHAHEVLDGDHRALLALVKECKGKVMLSGRPGELYDHALAEWTRHKIELPSGAAAGMARSWDAAYLWCNF